MERGQLGGICTSNGPSNCPTEPARPTRALSQREKNVANAALQ
jgi:hypothetical protein